MITTNVLFCWTSVLTQRPADWDLSDLIISLTCQSSRPHCIQHKV